MGHIKEPKGVDFVIQSEPLTNEDKAAISEFIRRYKRKHSIENLKKSKRRSISSKKNMTKVF